MDIKKLRALSKKDLEAEKNKINEEITKLKREQWQGKLKDTNEIREKRKEMARLLTVVKEKEVLEELAGGKSENENS